MRLKGAVKKQITRLQNIGDIIDFCSSVAIGDKEQMKILPSLRASYNRFVIFMNLGAAAVDTIFFL